MTVNPTFPPIGDAASVKLVFTTATVPPSDDTLDVSDYWSEEMDPENEHGLLVHATFDRTVKWDAFDGGEYAVHRLSGLTVENTDNIVFIDREGALSIFGEKRFLNVARKLSEVAVNQEVEVDPVFPEEVLHHCAPRK